MQENLVNLIFLFNQSSLLVKIVIFILISASITSWALILYYIFACNKINKQKNIFEEKFWSGYNLHHLYNLANKKDNIANNFWENIFCAGFEEFLNSQKSGLIKNQEAALQGIARNMQIAQERLIIELEKYLTWLATIGSVSPYVGLVGTVWGIMNSLNALGALSEQASIALVAPGISESLITTAIGLFAAIPAVIAYNRISYYIGTILQTSDHFQQEFINLISHQIYNNKIQNSSATSNLVD